MLKNANRFIFPTGIFVIVIALWHAAVPMLEIPEYILPKPLDVVQKLATSELWAVHGLYTASEALLGFLVGSVFAVILAIPFVHSEIFRLSFYPYVIALKTIPIVAIAPLLVMWFGSGIFSKAMVAALISFFPTLINSIRGLMAIDDEASDLFRSIGASQWQMFVKLRFPTSLPYIFAALKISSTLSVIGAIVGEFTGANKGLGFLILYSSRWLDTAQMFAGILVASLIGMIFFSLLSVLERKVVYWTVPL